MASAQRLKFDPAQWERRKAPAKTVLPPPSSLALRPVPSADEMLRHAQHRTAGNGASAAAGTRARPASAGTAERRRQQQQQQQHRQQPVVVVLSEMALQQQQQGFQTQGDSRLQRYRSPTTRALDAAAEETVSPPPLHALGEIPRDEQHRRIHPSLAGLGASLISGSGSALGSASMLQAGSVGAALRRESSGRILRSASWRREHAADGELETTDAIFGSSAGDGAVQQTDGSSSPALRLSRRKSLVKLMSMPTDAIAALGDIGATISKVHDEGYDLADDLPGSPLLFAQRGASGSPLGGETGSLDGRQSPLGRLGSAADFRPLRVGRMRPEHQPRGRVGWGGAGASAAGARPTFQSVDSALLPSLSDVLEDEGVPTDAEPLSVLGALLGRARACVEDIAVGSSSGSASPDSPVAASRSLQAWNAQSQSLAHHLLRHCEQLVTVELAKHLRDVEARVLEAERATAMEKACAARKEEELRALQAHMRSLGMVPMFRGVVAPRGSVAVVHWDAPDASAVWAADPVAAKAALATLAGVLRQLQAELGGYEACFLGDSGAAAFAAVRGAFDFSLRLQKQLVGVAWPEALLRHPQCEPDSRMVWRGLRVRVSIHVGVVDSTVDPATQRAQYFGETVRAGAELLRFAHAGTIIATDDALAALPKGVSPQHLATHGGAALESVPTPLVVDDTYITAHRLVPASLRERLERVAVLELPLRFSRAYCNRPLDLDPQRSRTCSTLERHVRDTKRQLAERLEYYRAVTTTERLQSFDGTALGPGPRTAAVVAMCLAGLADAYEVSEAAVARMTSVFYEIVKSSVALTGGVIVFMSEGSALLVFVSRSEACAVAAAVHSKMLEHKWSRACPTAIEHHVPEFAEVFVGTRRIFNGPRMRCGIAYGEVVLAEAGGDPPHLGKSDSVQSLPALNSARNASNASDSGSRSPQSFQVQGVRAAGHACELAASLAAFAVPGETLAAADVVGHEATRAAITVHTTFNSIGKHRLQYPRLDGEVFQLLPAGLEERRDHLHGRRGNILAVDSAPWPPPQLRAVADGEHARITKLDAEVDKAHGLLVSEARVVSTIPSPQAAHCTLVVVETPLSHEFWTHHAVAGIDAHRSLGRVLRMCTMELADGYESWCAHDAFVFAFMSTLAAARFAATCMEKLCIAYWPPALAEASETARELEGDVLLYHGLRARMSISRAQPSQLHVGVSTTTGRARYSGQAVRTAVELAAIAAPGQIIVDDETHRVLVAQLSLIGNPTLQPAGTAFVCGTGAPFPVHTLLPHSLRARTFPLATASTTIAEWLTLRRDDDDRVTYTIAKDSNLLRRRGGGGGGGGGGSGGARTRREQPPPEAPAAGTPTAATSRTAPDAAAAGVLDSPLGSSSTCNREDDDEDGVAPWRLQRLFAPLADAVRGLALWGNEVLASESGCGLDCDRRARLHGLLAALSAGNSRAAHAVPGLPDPEPLCASIPPTPTDGDLDALPSDVIAAPQTGGSGRRASVATRRKSVGGDGPGVDDGNSGEWREALASEMCRIHQLVRMCVTMARDYLAGFGGGPTVAVAGARGPVTEEDYLRRFAAICRELGIRPGDDAPTRMSTDRRFAAFLLQAADSEPPPADLAAGRGVRPRELVRSVAGHLARMHQLTSKALRGMRGSAAGGGGAASSPGTGALLARRPSLTGKTANNVGGSSGAGAGGGGGALTRSWSAARRRKTASPQSAVLADRTPPGASAGRTASGRHRPPAISFVADDGATDRPARGSADRGTVDLIGFDLGAKKVDSDADESTDADERSGNFTGFVAFT